MKTLERRLASVLNQAFDDCPNLRGRFRLLDCFSDLVHRPAIAEELQRKHVAMVLDFSAEVALVMQVETSLRRIHVSYHTEGCKRLQIFFNTVFVFHHRVFSSQLTL